jgi:hypothetical protein
VVGVGVVVRGWISCSLESGGSHAVQRLRVAVPVRVRCLPCRVLTPLRAHPAHAASKRSSAPDESRKDSRVWCLRVLAWPRRA